MALLTAARRASRRDHLMLLMAFWHGLRVSEVIALTRESVADGCLQLKRLKGSLRTRQELIGHDNPILDERTALTEYLVSAGINQKLFPISRRRADQLIKAYGEEAAIPRSKRHMHVLKHTIAMQTIHSAGIENVRQWLGHKSISSTGAYLKVSDEDAGRAVRGAVRF